MLNFLKALMSPPTPAGPPQSLRKFSPRDRTITQDGVRLDGDAWRIDVTGERSVQLFEIADPGAEQCVLAYRAELRTQGLKGKAHLEMWCRLPGRGEFFSKDLPHAVSGTTDWSRCEAPFFLKKGQCPDLLKLNVWVKGTGTVWVRNVEVTRTPLA